jgi:hypothetical protein
MLNLERKVGRVTRGVRLALSAAALARKHGRPSVVLSFGGGLGDQLLLSCVARELKRRGERCIWLASRHAELFWENSDVAHVIPEMTEVVHWLLKKARGSAQDLSYARHIPEERRDIPPAQHVIASLCEQAGVHGSIQIRPHLVLTDHEVEEGRRVLRQVSIQSTGGAAKYFMWTKEWFPERFQQVVDELAGEANFVQMGHSADPRLEGVLDLRGKTSVRETAAVLAASDLFVGLVGFLMHLARSVDTPSVIIYGGRELPSQSGYSCNTNLTGQAECAPCWRYDDCPGQRSCMDQITVDMVCRAIRMSLDCGSRSMAEDILTV